MVEFLILIIFMTLDLLEEKCRRSIY